MNMIFSSANHSIRIVSLGLLLLATTMATSTFAMDKRTFVHIVQPGTNAFHLVVVNTEASSSQYLPNGQLQAKVENNNVAARAIARFSVAENLEFTFEIPYLLKREQDRTNAAGITTSNFDSEGLGDADIQLTWQARDSRKGGFGLIAGLELQMPTGDKDRGLGSETWDTSLRTTLSQKTKWGFPYLMAIYTDTGTTKIEGIRVDPSNDLFLGAGFKTRYWNNFGLDLMVYRYIITSQSISENNGFEAVTEKHDTPGWKIYGRYLVTKSLEWMILYERSNPEDHNMTFNSQTITKKPGTKERFGTAFKYFW